PESCMASSVTIHVTVAAPSVAESPTARTGACQILVESTRPLPRAPYVGTVRVGGEEEGPTGRHPVRLLRDFTVRFVDATPHGHLYDVAVDLSDERPARAAGYPREAHEPRRVV